VCFPVCGLRVCVYSRVFSGYRCDWWGRGESLSRTIKENDFTIIAYVFVRNRLDIEAYTGVSSILLRREVIEISFFRNVDCLIPTLVV
jgi:hypothetical protein